MRGYGFLEAGVMPGRWQFLPWQIRYAFTLQASYAQGDMSQYLADNPTKAGIQMVSVGGGLRVDRLYQLGRIYSIAPFMGYTTHYQRYFRQIDTGFLQTAGFSPEFGVNNFFRLSRKSPWHLMVTVAAGSYLYAEQNLTYFRAGVGIEYVIK